jgi:osmotically inducible protein OsmC
MPNSRAEAEWKGTLREGNGQFKAGSGLISGAYTFATRFESAKGTNPEELIASAHAACFSMALAAGLTKAGHKPNSIKTTANVTLDKVGEGFGITKIELDTVGDVPGVDAATFQQQAEGAKANCPVSKALAGVQISLKARLK